MSALDQTFKSIEYIIVDDCGQDNSMNIIREILKDHPRKKDVYIYTHLKNKGLSVARNTGLQKLGESMSFYGFG
ncbi:glycosyltransferase family 2 protein [Bacteroides fragilis]